MSVKSPRAALGLYAILLSILVIDYLALPRLLVKAGLAASPAWYYAGLIALEALLAVAALVDAARILGGIGILGLRGATSRVTLVRALMPGLAVAAFYLLMELVVGFRVSPVRGPLGALLSGLIYALIAVPAALAFTASSGLGDYAYLAAVPVGLAALNPGVLLAAQSSWGPQALVSVTSYLIVGIALGFVGLYTYEKGSMLESYTVTASFLIVMGALPVMVAMGSIGVAVASVAGLYAAYLTVNLFHPARKPVKLGVEDSPEPAPDAGEAGNGEAGRMKVRKIWRSPLLWAVVGLAVALVALGAAGVMVWKPLVVVTGSMKPSINPGDVVVLRHISSSPQVGDVVTYKMGNAFITHRVVEAYQNGSVVTKGDANDAPDPYLVPPSAILGKVWLRVPLVGWLVILAEWSPVVRLLVVASAAAVIALVVIRW